MLDGKATADRTQSSVSDLYGQDGFLQLSREAAVSVPRHSTDSEQLSATLKKEDVQNPSKQSMPGTTDSVRDLTAGRDMLVLRLSG